jgi:hypothetical protein
MVQLRANKINPIGDLQNMAGMTGARARYWLIVTRTANKLQIVEHPYGRSPLGDRLDIPDDKVNENQLHGSPDLWVPHKTAREKQQKQWNFSLKENPL